MQDQFEVILEKVEGKLIYCVVRRDGASFGDGILSYNFERENWWAALECAVDLELRAKNN